MSTTILAIDLGKFNSVLCWYEDAVRCSEIPGELSFGERGRQPPDGAPVRLRSHQGADAPRSPRGVERTGSSDSGLSLLSPTKTKTALEDEDEQSLTHREATGPAWGTVGLTGATWATATDRANFWDTIPSARLRHRPRPRCFGLDPTPDPGDSVVSLMRPPQRPAGRAEHELAPMRPRGEAERTRVSIPAATPPRRRHPSGIEPAL